MTWWMTVDVKEKEEEILLVCPFCYLVSELCLLWNLLAVERALLLFLF